MEPMSSQRVNATVLQDLYFGHGWQAMFHFLHFPMVHLFWDLDFHFGRQPLLQFWARLDRSR